MVGFSFLAAWCSFIGANGQCSGNIAMTCFLLAMTMLCRQLPQQIRATPSGFVPTWSSVSKSAIYIETHFCLLSSVHQIAGDFDFAGLHRNAWSHFITSVGLGMLFAGAYVIVSFARVTLFCFENAVPQ